MAQLKLSIQRGAKFDYVLLSTRARANTPLRDILIADSLRLDALGQAVSHIRSLMFRVPHGLIPQGDAGELNASIQTEAGVADVDIDVRDDLPRVKKLEGCIVTVTPYELLAGWAIDRNNPDAFVPLVVLVDGEPIHTLAVASARRDAEKRFSCGLPACACDGAFHLIDVQFAEGAGTVLHNPIFCAKAAGVWIVASSFQISGNVVSGVVFCPQRPDAVLSVTVMTPDGRSEAVACDQKIDTGYRFLERDFGFRANVRRPLTAEVCISDAERSFSIHAQLKNLLLRKNSLASLFGR